MVKAGQCWTSPPREEITSLIEADHRRKQLPPDRPPAYPPVVGNALLRLAVEVNPLEEIPLPLAGEHRNAPEQVLPLRRGLGGKRGGRRAPCGARGLKFQNT